MKAAIAKLKDFYEDLVQKRYSTLAGTLVFFLLTSIVPLAFLIALLFGAIGLDPTVLMRVPGLGRFSEGFQWLQTAADRAGNGATVFLVFSSLYSAANFFYHLRRSGEMIYGRLRPKKGLITRLSALVMLFVLFGLLVLLIAAVTLGEAALRLLGIGLLSRIGLYALLAAVGLVILVVVNLYVAPQRPRVRSAAVGAAVTLGLWVAATFGFNVYLRYFGYERLYGGACMVVAAMFWLYLLMLGLTVGFVAAKRTESAKIVADYPKNRLRSNR